MLHATRRTILGAAALSLPAIVRAQGKEPIKIGNALPLTGSQAGYGKDFDTGMRMAAKDVNDAGGIEGRPVEILCLDTQAEPQLGINAANRFIGVEKLPMFYVAWSAVVKAIAPIANREKVLAINHGANSPEIATLGDYVYSTFPLADVDITKLARYMYNTVGKRRAAVLYINNDTGIDAAKIYRDTFIAAGGEVVAFEAYDPKATEFTGMLLKTRAANPDTVHVHGLTADTPQVIAQMRQLGLQQRVTSYSAAYNPKLLEQLGPAAEGLIVTSLAPGVKENPNVQKLLDRWKAEQNRVPNGLPYVQYQYDMVYLAKALYEYVDKKSQPATGDFLREALLTIKEFDLPMTGKMIIDGHRVNKPVYLLTVEKGVFRAPGDADLNVLDPVILAQILWTGIATSSPYVLMTLGFALTLKVTGLWNFAHAGLMAIAFYTMFFAIDALGLPVAAAMPLAIVTTGGASWLIEAYGLQVLRDRGSGNLTFFIFTLILSEFVIYVITLLFGTEPQTLFKSILSPVTIVADIAVSNWDIVAVSVASIGLISLYAFLTFTREGQFLGAVADNARLAELYGISARRAWRVVSILAAVFIVAAMYLVGTHGGVIPNSPLELILTAVIATLLGGIGRIFAAAWAAVFLGLLQSFSILVIDSRWQNLLLYGVLFIAILIFPRGVRMPRFRFALAGR